MEKFSGYKNKLFHGSPVKVDKLIPHQACDAMFNEGCEFAIYATSSINMAICFSLGCIENGPNPEREMLPEKGFKMHFKNCHPAYGAKGYIYILDKSKFTPVIGTQWICCEELIPDEVIEIDVNNYLDLCVIE